MGSDHDVYQDSSFGIPAIYLNDWPDRYIHTNFDTAANIDPTKLKRAAPIGGASGYFLTQVKEADLPAINWLILTDAMERRARTIRRGDAQQSAKGLDLMRRNVDYDVQLARSAYRFLALDVAGAALIEDGMRELPAIVKSRPDRETSGDGPLRFASKSEPKGPLAVFGFDYFADHAKAAGVATPKLLSYEGLWGAGEEYAYEVLNFADGKRNAQQIRDAVSAEYGPVPLELVVEYLRALEKIGVVEQVK